MEKVLISLPEQLVARMRATIPTRQRSKVITRLLESEVEKREQALYECAVTVEKDTAIKNDVADEWDNTLKDGLQDNESW
jgi:metal-responsive CopG/Arc/MetJ family transcriptional regulator